MSLSEPTTTKWDLALDGISHLKGQIDAMLQAQRDMQDQINDLRHSYTRNRDAAHAALRRTPPRGGEVAAPVSDPPPDEGDLSEELEISIQAVAAQEQPDGTFRLVINTSRGELPALLHPCEGEPGAAIFAGGALGGFDGPAGGLYGRLAQALASASDGTGLTCETQVVLHNAHKQGSLEHLLVDLRRLPGARP